MVDQTKYKVFDIPEIKKFQRNRHPLLFIDKITKLIPGKEARGLKCFSYNEWFFPSHFDDEPNVPGFIQIESLVQTFIMTFLSLEESNSVAYSDLPILPPAFKIGPIK